MWIQFGKTHFNLYPKVNMWSKNSKKPKKYVSTVQKN